MAGEMQVTVVGNLASDPELRWTASGHAVASFTIAQTPRSFNRETNQWVDDETLWVRCSVWREEAENVSETLQKGMRVIAHGFLKARSFETKDGQQRTNWEMTVEDIGPSLKWATAQVNRAPKQGSSGFGGAPSTANTAPAASWNAAPNTAWGGGQQQQGGPVPF